MNAGRNKTKPKCLRLKKKKKHFILQDSSNRVDPFIQLSYKIWTIMHTPVLIC